MSDHRRNDGERDDDELDIRFERPSSYVTSIRLTQEESQLFTNAAREAGLPLSTFIKQAAQSHIMSTRNQAERRIEFAGAGSLVAKAAFGSVLLGYSSGVTPAETTFHSSYDEITTHP